MSKNLAYILQRKFVLLKNLYKIATVAFSIILSRKLCSTTSMAERFTRVPRVWEVWSSSPGAGKYYTVSQTVRHRFNISNGLPPLQHFRK